MHEGAVADLERSCADWIRMAPPEPGLASGGIERMEAFFAGHAYDRHRHDTFAIGFTLDGVQSFDYRGAHVDSTPGRLIVLHPDECLQMTFYTNLAEQYLEHHPGAKLKLAALSEQLLWQPNVIETGAGSSGIAKRVVEPAYMWPLYALAAVGLRVDGGLENA